MNLDDLRPPDFRATLDLLTSLEGRRVRVAALSQPPGQPLSHTQLVVVGILGQLEMVDNTIDQDANSVAAFSIGGAPSGLYLSPSTFFRSQPLSAKGLRIDFKHAFSIQVDVAHTQAIST